MVTISKVEARAWAKSRLSSFDDARYYAGSRAICRHLATFISALRNEVRIFCFSSLRDEPNIRSLRSEFSQHSFFLPRISNESQMDFFSFNSDSDLIQNRFGILEPPLSSIRTLPTNEDIILVPCLSLTKYGDRLGRGKGYYDRYLATLNARPRLIGICFEDSFAYDSTWATSPHDIQVDDLCTEVGIRSKCQKF